METLTSIEAMRQRLRQHRAQGQRVVFVPTMGNLHDGHLSLVRQAEALGECVVVSIFVNAMQFGENEDFSSYPRTIEEDIQKLSDFRVNFLFMPEPQEVYPRPLTETTQVMVPELSEILCGAIRPGHFAGVSTVVSILFNIIQPDSAVFGEKDYQQLLIIKRLVADLHMNIQIIGGPTVREEDGLAMSSRNSYLTAEERKIAPRLYQSLCQARDLILQGSHDYSSIERLARERIKAAGFRLEYFTVRRAEDLGEPGAEDMSLVLLTAARLGSARLIDNLKLSLKNHP